MDAGHVVHGGGSVVPCVHIVGDAGDRGIQVIQLHIRMLDPDSLELEPRATFQLGLHIPLINPQMRGHHDRYQEEGDEHDGGAHG